MLLEGEGQHLQDTIGRRHSSVSLRAFLLAAIAVGLVLRFVDLGGQSLWVDEMISLQLATYASGAEFWHGLLDDIHGPLTSVLLHGWIRFGDGDRWLRLLYALPAIATVPLTYVLGRRLFDRATGKVVHRLTVADGWPRRRPP